METRLVFKGVPEDLHTRARERWKQQEERIERVLRRFRPELRRITVTMEKNRRGYEARGVISVPTGTIIARGKGADWTNAMDDLAERLFREARKHKERLHDDAVSERKRRLQADFTRAGIYLEESRRADAREAFFDLLKPLLGNLREHAGHELAIAQLEGWLEPGEITVSGLLDEILIRAWDRWEERPQDLPLGQWLFGLLHEILDEKMDARGEVELVSLEERPTLDPRHAEAEKDWDADQAFWFWPDEERVLLEDLIPDEGAPPESWKEAEAERTWILAQLSEQPRLRRRAYMLYAIEGWEAAEIALLQRRSVDEVEADLAEVRAWLEERARAG